MKKLSFPLVLIALLVAGVTSVHAGSLESAFDLSLGHVWVEVDGNEAMYRSQINEEEGLLLRSLWYADRDGPFYDELVVTADGIGDASPFGRFRLQLDRQHAYRLRVDYLHANQYSALPNFANPFVEAGVTPGQHTIDRDRDMLEVELELFPGKAITPLIALRHVERDGPGRTTYHVGEDEFHLDSDVDDTETEIELGLGYRLGRFEGQVSQAWRQFEGRETVSLVPGAGAGNDLGELLGEEITADQLSYTSRVDIDTPVTRFWTSGALGDRVRVAASFVQADRETEADSEESVVGHLASFRLGRFYEEREQSIRSTVDSPDWRGTVRVDAVLAEHFNLSVGYTQRHRELDGWSLIRTLYLDTVNFSGARPEDIEEVLEAHTRLDNEHEMAEVAVEAHSFNGFSFELGFASTQQDLTVDQDASEVIIPGGQEGDFERQVDRIRARAAYQNGPFRASLLFDDEDADDSILRTDFRQRRRLKFQAQLKIGDRIRVGGTGSMVENDNMDSGIGFDGEMKEVTLDVEATPIDDLTLFGSFGIYEADSTVAIRRPQDFVIETSAYDEEGELFDVGFEWAPEWATLGGGFSRYENDGNLGFSFDRAYVRAEVGIAADWSTIVEASRIEYEETLLTLADYEADRIGLFLRWSP